VLNELGAVELGAAVSVVAMVDERVVGRAGTLGAAEGSDGDGVAATVGDDGAIDEVMLDNAEAVPARSHGFGGDGIVFQTARWGEQGCR
jgi:hypothetical protein